MKLYIVGNGFDLYHYLPSSYKDFQNFIKEKDKYLFELVEKYFNYDDEFWHAFETNLSKLHEFMLVGDVLRSLGSGGWDADALESYEPTIEYYTFGIYSQLKNCMVDWIKELNLLPLRRKYPNLDADSFFISFNYTNTLERHYHVHPSCINYIHSHVQKENCNLIFGHDMEESDYEFDDNQEGLGRFRVQSFLNHIRKPVDQILKDNEEFWRKLSVIKEVIILGHSLSSVDGPYFSKIANHVNKECLWKVSYYDEVDAENHLRALVKYGVNSRFVEPFDILPGRPRQGKLF